MLPFDVIRLTDLTNVLPVEVDSSMPTWNGGILVKYHRVTTVMDGNNFRVTRVVSLATPSTVIGFLLRGSLESSDAYTSYNYGVTRLATIVNTGSHLFKYYESDNYVLNQTVYCSVNGLLTNVNGVGSRPVGIVMGLPGDNDSYLGVDILFP